MLQKITEYLRDNAGLLVTRAITGLVIFTLVYAIAFMVARLVERALKAKSRRGATLATIVRSVISLSGLVAGLVMGLSQLGINVATVLAGAGVIGLAIGFGAQTLVKDCISGFFLILDDVLEVGDRVEINGATGVIERVGLRVTQLRADNGQLWYLPNGTVEKVGNFNREWNRAEVNVGLAYEASVDEALGVLEEVGKKWAAENPELSLAEPIAQGVLELADSVGEHSPGRAHEAHEDGFRRLGAPEANQGGLRRSRPRDRLSPPGVDRRWEARRAPGRERGSAVGRGREARRRRQAC